ncbi:Increased rDNA silencing protein [Elasticomyces elasticus]|nr:Increased rDNA silencing protein [Elasticomyces elasticus]KAK3667567.1 Increased rDNA silencing protein [Elasticomyces elasticus]KAK4928476.1 Increased rDNA silencing protein [Elasticomyces elasticus]KAK5753584.1 Increased rDNA silencing protein [Elasticomyces elasticus]
MSGPPRTPSRTPSFASINTTGDSQSAALLGATKAFGKPAPKARAASHNYSGNNGALAAANWVSPKHGLTSSPGQPATPPSGRRNGNGNGNGHGNERTPTLEHTTTPNLAVPKRRERETSPSQQAAQLAAARSPDGNAVKTTTRPRADTAKKPYVAPKPRRLSDHYSNVKSQNPTDATHIPPTTSLVKLFEQKASVSSPSVQKRPSPVTVRPSHDLPIRSPKPIHTDGGITAVFQMELGGSKEAPKPASKALSPQPQHGIADRSSSDDDNYVSASEDTAPNSSPLTIRKRDSRPSSAASVASVSLTNTSSRRPRPSPSPLRHSSSFTQPLQIPKPPPSRNVTSPADMSSISSSQSTTRSIAAQYHMLHPRRMTPLNTGDDLANAIVASSLASARAPSPRKMDPPPPIPSRSHKHHRLGFSRTPSPTKHAGMRHTLRKEESEDSGTEDENHPYGKHKKKRIVRKHPNKHHEGDRKRWRDAVTERERKRYEGVWAANKGMHCSLTAEEKQQRKRDTIMADQVSNIVARDVWSRSRLSEVVLESVWDLVDTEGVGRLGKEEFVVGMWLIDQRLKGRKLPPKVSDSVWQSVRGLQGIKIRKHMH